MRGIHRPQVNSPHKGQWRRALLFPLIYAWVNDWENNREADDLRRHRAHYDISVMNVRALVSQITDKSIIYPTACSGEQERKLKIRVLLDHCKEMPLVIKGRHFGKAFPHSDVIMRHQIWCDKIFIYRCQTRSLLMANVSAVPIRISSLASIIHARARYRSYFPDTLAPQVLHSARAHAHVSGLGFND